MCSCVPRRRDEDERGIGGGLGGARDGAQNGEVREVTAAGLDHEERTPDENLHNAAVSLPRWTFTRVHTDIDSQVFVQRELLHQKIRGDSPGDPADLEPTYFNPAYGDMAQTILTVK